MKVYFNDEGGGRSIQSPEPTPATFAAIETPPFSLDVNAYAWATDEAERRGLIEYDGEAWHKAATYDESKAYDTF